MISSSCHEHRKSLLQILRIYIFRLVHCVTLLPVTVRTLLTLPSTCNRAIQYHSWILGCRITPVLAFATVDTTLTTALANASKSENDLHDFFSLHY